MKTNKGSVLLTFLIIMLVVAVGGSAYYFGTKKIEAPVAGDVAEEINENNLPVNEEVENVVDDSVKPTPAPTPVTSSITILSPNGGEKIIVGQTYTIKWKTDGFLKTDDVSIILNDGSIYCPPPESGMTGCQNEFFIIKTKNTGSYVWDTNQKVQKEAGFMSIWSGSKYKISVGIWASGNTTKSASDMSNAVFSIERPVNYILQSVIFPSYINGEIEECTYRNYEDKFYRASLNHVDGGSSVFNSENGSIVGSCQGFTGACTGVIPENCQRIYVVSPNIWGYPAVNTYNLH